MTGELIVIEFKNIRKTFPGTVALDDVSFTAKSGEITALLGQNGAGKSTLMKILSGAYQKDSGSILIDGTLVEIMSPIDAENRGIGIVYQELSGLPHLTVSENIVIGRDPVRYGFLDVKKQREIAGMMLERLGAKDISPDQRLDELSVSQQQICEIAKCMAANPRIVIFDEPTTSLTNREKEKLFAIMKKMRQDGLTVLFITHYLEDALRMSDQCVIMKDGRVVCSSPMVEMDEKKIVGHMITQRMDSFFPEYHSYITDHVALETRALSDHVVHDCNIQVRYGEVLGLSGLIGAGRTELAHLIIGARKSTDGQVLVDGSVRHIHGVYDALCCGIAYISEDRRTDGLNLSMGIDFNLSLSSLVLKSQRVMGKPPFVSDERIWNMAEEIIGALAIKCWSPKQKVSNLSGGNQQKVSIGKMIASGAKVLIFDEPTKGIDVSAKAKVYEIIRELAREGRAIIVISSYTPELQGVCDRICVMSRGRIISDFARDTAEEELMLAQQR